MEKNILLKAEDDLHDDFAELAYLLSGYLKNLEQFRKEIETGKGRITEPSQQLLLSHIAICEESLRNSLSAISAAGKDLDNIRLTETSINQFAKQKAEYFSLLRTQVGIFASLLTATEWQSPSYEYSLQSQAGIQTGHIIGTKNDYKRDQHLNEQQYQNAFVKQYVDAIVKLPIHGYLTSSGMAAFTTILTMLQMQQKVGGNILLGKNSYFENKELIEKFFAGRVFEVDEMDSTSILAAIDNVHPQVVFFDTLCNASNIAVLDVPTILKYLVKTAKSETYVVLDNSTLSISCQPLKHILLKSLKVHLIVFESLNKYHQFGLDRVTAGIVWTFGRDMGSIFMARERAGTNIPDSSCYVLPSPDRKLLARRLIRLDRNAMLVATALQKYVKGHKSKIISEIIYPGLPSHPSYNWTRDTSFHGSYFVIQLQPKKQTVQVYKRFIKMVLREAKKEGVDIVAGTSFGFNTTRIYLTALHTKYGQPFVRVSVGTENRLEINKLIQVFLSVIENF